MAHAAPVLTRAIRSLCHRLARWTGAVGSAIIASMNPSRRRSTMIAVVLVVGFALLVAVAGLTYALTFNN